MNLTKVSGREGNVLVYKELVEHRPICSPMELATTKKIWVAPAFLPKRERPALGYLLLPLMGCTGNQGLYGTIGGRGGCCPFTASSLFCGLKNHFGAPDLQRPYTKEHYSPACAIMSPYTNENPPPWCFTHDKQITFDEVKGVTERLNARGIGEKWEDRELYALIDKIDLPDLRNRGNGDRMISEDEFLRFMGKTHLNGLPRRGFVREPWERTNASGVKQEELYKCARFYGEDACFGNNEVNEFTFDVSTEDQERKKYPDCLVRYEYGAYTNVKNGEVWCANPTWYPRSQSMGGRTRCGCFPPPLELLPEGLNLFPGCPKTNHRCYTPPDWSEFS